MRHHDVVCRFPKSGQKASPDHQNPLQDSIDAKDFERVHRMNPGWAEQPQNDPFAKGKRMQRTRARPRPRRLSPTNTAARVRGDHCGVAPPWKMSPGRLTW